MKKLILAAALLAMPMVASAYMECSQWSADWNTCNGTWQETHPGYRDADADKTYNDNYQQWQSDRAQSLQEMQNRVQPYCPGGCGRGI